MIASNNVIDPLTRTEYIHIKCVVTTRSIVINLIGTINRTNCAHTLSHTHEHQLHRYTPPNGQTASVRMEDTRHSSAQTHPSPHAMRAYIVHMPGPLRRAAEHACRLRCDLIKRGRTHENNGMCTSACGKSQSLAHTLNRHQHMQTKAPTCKHCTHTSALTRNYHGVSLAKCNQLTHTHTHEQRVRTKGMGNRLVSAYRWMGYRAVQLLQHKTKLTEKGEHARAQTKQSRTTLRLADRHRNNYDTRRRVN